MKEVDTPCEEWPTKSYGKVIYEGKEWLVHRLVWTQVNGPIPDGFVVRHRCDNPPCFKVDHLELGTMKDNSQDMVRRNRCNPHQAQKTHCPQGHEYTEENTYRPPNRGNERQCRTCLRDKAREKYRRKNPGIKLRKP